MNETELRRKRFRVALALAEMTQLEFAKRARVSGELVSHQLNGRRNNRALAKKMDAFIGRQFCERGSLMRLHGAECKRENATNRAKESPVCATQGVGHVVD